MLTLSDVMCRIQGRLVLEGGSANLADGWRVGVVGHNGAGKTTLFKLIVGELPLDGGEIAKSPRQRLGMVRQDMPDTDAPVLDVVLAADTERAALLAQSETETDAQKLADIYERLGQIDAYTAPARAATILAGLGFSEAQVQAPFNSFSGGWRMRVALAAALFVQPEILLLDEPTNHLDLEAILWLETYLAKYPFTLLIISHDRQLLNGVATHILHIHERKLQLYTGNYDTFERERAERLHSQQKLYEKQQAAKAHMQKFIDRFRYKATKARQAQSRIKMLEKMDFVEAVLAERSVKFSFPAPERLPPPIFTIDHADVGYGEKVILHGVHETLDMDDRIALLGANGNGKSTLMKLLAGKLKPLSGSVKRPGKLRIGYFAQHQAEELNLASTPFMEMRELLGTDMPEKDVRARLGAFGFSKPLSDNLIGTLSGGEKARLLFAFMSVHAPHLLILDEPTNHLDMEAREALIEALNNYEGAVMIVSHDPGLLERVADRLWLVAGGKVESFDGDLADYKALVLESARTDKRDKAGPKGDKKDQRKVGASRRQELAPLKDKVTAAEKRLAQLKAQCEKLEAAMAAPEFYDDSVKAQAAQRQHGELLREIEAEEAAWLAASEAYEAARE